MKLELHDVESVVLIPGKLVSDCQYGPDDTPCKNDDGTPCDQKQCVKMSPTEIQVSSQYDLDFMVHTIVLDHGYCNDPRIEVIE